MTEVGCFLRNSDKYHLCALITNHFLQKPSVFFSNYSQHLEAKLIKCVCQILLGISWSNVVFLLTVRQKCVFLNKSERINNNNISQLFTFLSKLSKFSFGNSCELGYPFSILSMQLNVGIILRYPKCWFSKTWLREDGSDIFPGIWFKPIIRAKGNNFVRNSSNENHRDINLEYNEWNVRMEPVENSSNSNQKERKEIYEVEK